MKTLLLKHRLIVFVILVVAILTAIYLAADKTRTSQNQNVERISLSEEEAEWIRLNPVVTVGVDQDFAPIEYLDENGKYIGVTADFLSLLEQKTGLEFKIDLDHSWEESIARMRAGQIHMLGAAVPSEQRRIFMDFTEPYAWLSGVIIVRKDVTEPMSLEKLKGMKVAVVYNYIWRDILEASHPELDLSPAANIEAALKKVSFGMADAMVGFMGTASHHIERLAISNLKISGETVSVLDISFAVNKATPQLKTILNRALEQTSEEQKRSILRKWISLELTGSTSFKRLFRIVLPGIAVGLLVLVGIIIWNRSLQQQVVQRTQKLNKELARRRKIEDALRESEEKYRSIFGNIQDVYYEITPGGRVLEISPSIEKVFGYQRHSMLEQQLSRMFVNPEECRAMIEEILNEKRLTDYETLLVRPDGEMLNCSMNAVSVRTSSEEPVKIIGSIRNITDRIKAQKDLKNAYHELEKRVQERTAELSLANEEMNKAKEAADEATRAKSNFLANMSHEIRTPLSGVISASELVMNESPPKKIARYINIIRSSGQALLGVIDDILDFSKIEAGKLDIEPHLFNLDQLVRRTTNLFQHRVAGKKITLSANMAPDIPIHLMGDSFRLQQILTNLIGNAVKFTDEGGAISLEISWTAGSGNDDPVQITFEVADTGIGISREHQDLLFVPFSQIDASTTRKHGGSGLGLSICGQLVKMMNGRISVESSPGEGSRFIFTIPIEVCSRSQKEEENRSLFPDQEKNISSYRNILKGRKVLVAEDTPTNQEIVLAILDLVRIESALADTGLMAVAEVQKRDYDAVLMDIQMPEMDGFEATRAIREIKGMDSLPIIAMTAHTFKEDKDKCFEAGMNGYISKPLSQEILFKTLVRFICKKEIEAFDHKDVPEQKDAARSFSGLPDRLPGIELVKAMDTLGITTDVFLKILKTFHSNHEKIILKIEKAWEQQDLETLVTLVHGIKGSAAGIGAEKLYEVAFRIEKQYRDADRFFDIETSGSVPIEKELNTVLDSIKILLAGQMGAKKENQQVEHDPEKAGGILSRLKHALAFPEIGEIETLMDQLESVFEHPDMADLRHHIDSYDHDLAMASVEKMITALKGRFV